jgi:hypothetical protein
LPSVAFNVCRRFAGWLKKKGLIRLADADESFDKEDSLASCFRGSLGTGKVVELTDDPQEAHPALIHSRIDWATLLCRTYDFDLLACFYGGRVSGELASE